MSQNKDLTTSPSVLRSLIEWEEDESNPLTGPCIQCKKRESRGLRCKDCLERALNKNNTGEEAR